MIWEYGQEILRIHNASSQGDISVLDTLLKNRSLINIRYCHDLTQGIPMYFQTPLHTASMYGQLTIVEYLLNNGADINAKDSRIS